MRHVLPIVIWLSFALWFGAAAALFIFVQILFGARHGLGLEAAPLLFEVYERYQLILAAIVLGATIGWRFLNPSRLKTALLALFAVAAVAAVVSTGLVTPRIEAMRLEALTQTEEFRRVHNLSIGIYVIQTLILAAAGSLLPLAVARPPAPPERPQRPSFRP